ncbi:MAG TPA: hypothetical protein DCL72_10205 [Rhizobiales bacterium]|nr:hypothetical protein [Hyphomicrobiales bacterium]
MRIPAHRPAQHGKHGCRRCLCDFRRKKPSSVGADRCLGYPLDDFVDKFAPPFPQHLKIDVDGNEDMILHGAGRTLADHRLRSVSIELDDRRPEQVL